MYVDVISKVMTKVKLKSDYHRNSNWSAVDIVLWCYNEFGSPSEFHITSDRWFVKMTSEEYDFFFNNVNDATLFKLRWT